MPLPYVLYWITPASGLAAYSQPCSCDLPPVWVPKAMYNPTFRDLNAGGFVSIGGETLLMKTNLQQTLAAASPPAILPPGYQNPSITSVPVGATTIIANGVYSGPDDQTHADERQSPPHQEDFLVFTDSLGRLCGEFDGLIFRSWNNTGKPGSSVTSAVAAPH